MRENFDFCFNVKNSKQYDDDMNVENYEQTKKSCMNIYMYQ